MLFLTKILTVDSFKSKVKDVLLEKLPEVVTKTFRHVITNQKLFSEAEVDFTSKVGNKLADSLFPFQRKGVKYVLFFAKLYLSYIFF